MPDFDAALDARERLEIRAETAEQERDALRAKLAQIEEALSQPR